MSEKIIALILKNYLRQLDEEISEIESKLPDDMSVNRKNIMGGKSTVFPILEGIKEFRSVLSNDIDDLIEDPE